MSEKPRLRTLSIGEFAAATQLTPKALRLYDEHGLLRPANTDRFSGYRLYSTDQVARGRLIRVLRDMSLSLQQIGELLAVETERREWVLRRFSLEAERRYVREKNAYQAALALLRDRRRHEAMVVSMCSRDAHVVSVWSFLADRRSFEQRYFEQQDAALEHLNDNGLSVAGQVTCALLDPLTEEEGRLELLVPIAMSDVASPRAVTTRRIAPGPYVFVASTRSHHPDGFMAAIDALFDWFDRHGHLAVDAPLVALVRDDHAVTATVQWAYSPAQSGEKN